MDSGNAEPGHPADGTGPRSWRTKLRTDLRVEEGSWRIGHAVLAATALLTMAIWMLPLFVVATGGYPSMRKRRGAERCAAGIHHPMAQCTRIQAQNSAKNAAISRASNSGSSTGAK